MNTALNWLLVDPWGITALTLVACALVAVVTLAFEYTVIAVIAAAVEGLRGRRGAPAAPSSDQAGLRASQSSV